MKFARQSTRNLVFPASLLLALIFAHPASACPVCFNANEETRMAYLVTTIMLSALPLGMIGGLAFWFARQGSSLTES